MISTLVPMFNHSAIMVVAGSSALRHVYQDFSITPIGTLHFTLELTMQSQRDCVAQPGGELHDAHVRHGVGGNQSLRHELQLVDAAGPQPVRGVLHALKPRSI